MTTRPQDARPLPNQTGNPDVPEYDERNLATGCPDPTAERDRCERLFVASLPLIRRIVGSVARRHGLSADAAEEFGASVRLRIILDDYAVLRKFQGRCALSTYLTVVIQRMLLDDRVARWGKWRPSARSRRAGEAGILLERLIVRDGYTFDQAFEMVAQRLGAGVDRVSLAHLYDELTPRLVTRTVAEEELEDVAAAHGSPAAPLLRAADAELLGRAVAELRRALRSVSSQDRRLLHMHHAAGRSVAEISRALHVDQKPLYRRLHHLRRGLAAHLESRGLRSREVLAAIGADVEPGARHLSAA